MKSFPSHQRTFAPEPDATPPTGTRRTIRWLIALVAAVALGVLAVVLWQVLVLDAAEGPPGEGAVLPLPEGIEVVSQATGCREEGGRTQDCTRELIVVEDGTDARDLTVELADHFEDERDYQLNETEDLFSSLCEGGKTCLLIGPATEERLALDHPDLDRLPPEAVAIRAIRRATPS